MSWELYVDEKKKFYAWDCHFKKFLTKKFGCPEGWFLRVRVSKKTPRRPAGLDHANPYLNVLNVSSLFVLDSHLSAERAGQTYSSSIHVLNLPIWSYPEFTESYFTDQVGSINIGKLKTSVN